MTLSAFRETLTLPTPPDLTVPLKALWHEAKGDWNTGHDLLQDQTSAASAWVHAYFHRKEGDTSNAAYWYRRAGRPAANGAFETEWEVISTALLAAIK